MQEFNFVRPDNIEHLCELLSTNNARVMAGGTDLMLDLRQEDVPEIELIIDISNFPGLDYIEEDGELIRIGSAVTHARLESNDLINRFVPLLAEAAGSVGSPQIRNRGTVGGNIVTASPAADTISPLVALEAGVVIKNTRRTRNSALVDLFSGPYQTNLESDEVVSEIYFKKPAENSSFCFEKITRRKAVDKARINIAVIAEQEENGRINDLRIVPGSVTPVPRRFEKAERILMDKIPARELLERTAELVAEEMVSISGYRWSTDYKKPAIRNLTFRALQKVVEV